MNDDSMSKQTSFIYRLLTGSLLALVAGSFLPAAEPATRPNIVVMMVDDMGFAGPSIAPYRNPHYKTPGMDRLVSEGMLFTDFHASGG